ncbi:MAG TPA: FtsQ-type POTRA domain-containing protein [Thermodesulfovibrionales bacterium]|nr:FtsQ-type POTRA domain-containing protein [Thermodesulfovibrionales bacterium]
MKANRIKKSKRTLSILKTLRNISILTLIFGGAIVVYLVIHNSPVKSVFPVRNVDFSGNRHLTDDELRALTGIHRHDSLLTLSNDRISRQMLKSPWIRSVSIRKDLPDTLSITIKESEPFALLEMNEHLFLVDEKGTLLEELRGGSVPFLPVITADPYREKDGFSEALSLAKTMNEKGFSSDRDHIEIVAHKPHELTVTIDGLVVKIGAGGYEEKLERLVQIEEDIKQMAMPVDYIDLRFAGRAIVKPASEKVTK